MNNLAAGGIDPRNGRPWAYYETTGGGLGGGPDGPGMAATHSHMTNTLNTPAEALELAYPLRVVEQSVRRGSGGPGRHEGGDGMIRRTQFLGEATVTIVSERRTTAPWGLRGGSPGAPGRNALEREGEEIPLAGKTTFDARAGDVVRVETPGGGGWGEPAAS